MDEKNFINRNLLFKNDDKSYYEQNKNKVINQTQKGCPLELGISGESFHGKCFPVGNKHVMVTDNGYIQILDK